MRLKPYKTRYDGANAYWMARLAHAVYETKKGSQAPDEATILNDLKAEDGDFNEVRGFDKNSAQAMVVDHAQYIAVVFRGTDEGDDWLDNLDVRRVERLFGTFHKGFYDSVEDLWGRLDNTVKGFLRDEAKPVWFSGHSLGGAMATIAAAKYIEEDRPFSGLYTFGQPRCMGRKTSHFFRAEAGSRHYRFQNNNDIVTRVPTRLSGFSHVGRCIYISEERELIDEPGRWYKFVDRVEGAVGAVRERGLDLIVDHRMDRYLAAIRDWGDKPLIED